MAQALNNAALACGLMTLTLIVVVLIDVPFQLWSHAKKMRMSKEEIKREHKESEGDPQVKAKIRQQQQAMARRRMMSQVPTADVIVTNPTHYAVALKYEESRMSAPRVVAKGSDAVAQAIRELGAEHKVPMLEAPPLARALYAHVDLEQEIPATLYTAVAEVLAWAFGLKRARREGSVAPPVPRDVQVPALVISTAAGVMVSRVDTNQDVGQQMMGQLFVNPQVLILAAAVMGLLGMVPGMPNFVFLLFMVLLGSLAWWLMRMQKAKADAAKREERQQAAPAHQEAPEASWDDVQLVDILGLEVGHRLIAMVDHSQQGELLGRVKSVRKKFAQEVGFLPPVLVVQPALRPLMSRFLRRRLPQLVVMSQSEIPDDRSLRVSQRIGRQ